MASIKRETIRWVDRDGRDHTAERWVARYRDEAGRQRKRNFRRKTDGQRWLDETTAAIVTGQYADPKAGRVTFAQFYKRWSARQVWARGTRIAADQAATSVTFADVPLRSLRRSHVEQWVKSMSSHGLAASTIEMRYDYVAGCLRGAVRDRVIPSSPAENVRLPKARRAEAAMTIPEVEQVGKALAAADNGARAYVAVCAFAGLRQGEANGLQLGDVDFLRRTIKVSRQVQGQTRATAEVVPPKHGSERTIHVPSELTEILSEHVATYGTKGDAGWLFGTDEHRLNRNSATHLWATLRARVDMADFTLHDLRHFYASGLIAAGCDVVTVQRALGHSKPSITLDVYAHLWPTAEDRTRNAASGLLRQALAIPAPSTRPAEQH